MQRSPRLAELIKLLKESITDSSPPDKIKLIAEAIARLIRKKRERVKERYNILLPNWEESLIASPEQVHTYLSDPNFQLMLRRDVDISFSQERKSTNIFSHEINHTVENVRSKGRIIFENPYLVLSDSKVSIQSWARVKSISRSYKRHTSTSSNPHKSKFLRGIPIESIEHKLWAIAPAVLRNSNQLFMYGCFDSEIGTLPDKTKTKFVKMQCDREPRVRGRGFYTKTHCYPVSEKETLEDLKGVRDFIDLVYENKLYIKDL